MSETVFLAKIMMWGKKRIEDSKPETLFRLLADSVGGINGKAGNVLWITFLMSMRLTERHPRWGLGGGLGQGNTLGRCLVSD